MHNKIASIAGLLLAAGTASAATVSGRIVDEATQQPIAGAHLTVVSSIGGFQAIGPFADTDADGRYAFTFSDSQTQLLGIVAEAPGHAARDHGARRCNHPRSCESGGGALSVTPGANLVVDFALPPGARLHGRVTDLATGVPVAGAVLQLQASADSGFALRGDATSDANGDFAVDDLHTGSYTLTAHPPHWYWTDGTLPHLRYVWPDLHCDDVQQSCLALPAVPIALAAGTDGGAFDLRLRRGAIVRTRMLSLGNDAAVEQATRVAAGTATFGASARNGADGYAYVGPLLPGPVSLALEPQAERAYPAIVYPDRPCASTPCNLTDAPTLTVPEASLVTTADVHVAPLRTISGRVTDAAGSARAGIRVSAGDVRFGIMGPSGFAREATTLTDGDGNYRLEGFSNDNLVVRTQAATEGWIDVAWPDTACSGANLFCEDYTATYTRLDLTAAMHPAGIDLALRSATALEGRVVGTNGLPKPSWFVALIPAGASSAVQPVRTDADGRFRLSGLSSEAYYLWTSASPPTNSAEGTVYPGVACQLSYFTPPMPCDLAAATAVTPTGSGIGGLVIIVPPSDAIFSAAFD